jgi:hypothetical protein
MDKHIAHTFSSTGEPVGCRETVNARVAECFRGGFDTSYRSTQPPSATRLPSSLKYVARQWILYPRVNTWVAECFHSDFDTSYRSTQPPSATRLPSSTKCVSRQRILYPHVNTWVAECFHGGFENLSHRQGFGCRVAVRRIEAMDTLPTCERTSRRMFSQWLRYELSLTSATDEESVAE